jgi:hypothetical protein
VTDIPRESRVLHAVASLVDSLLVGFDVVDLLTDLTQQSAELLDTATAAVLLADPLNRLHLLAATTEETRQLELFQLQTEEGPCVDCFVTGQPVSVADLQIAADRWPRFVPAALAGGFASVHAVPMRAAGIVLGALGFSAPEPASYRRPTSWSGRPSRTSRVSRFCRSGHLHRRSCCLSCDPRCTGGSSSNRPRAISGKASECRSKRPSNY